jgi:hypothetical protein
MRIALIVALFCAALAGCAGPTLPPRPDVSFFVHQDPLMVPNPKVAPKRMGARMLLPPDIPAPICLTDADHIALQNYLDQVDTWRARR